MMLVQSLLNGIMKFPHKKNKQKTKIKEAVMENISTNDLTETINCLYRMKYTIEDTFLHIEQHISPELKDLLQKEIDKLTEGENKRLNSQVNPNKYTTFVFNSMFNDKKDY